MKIKKPQVHFIIKILLLKNECKIPDVCLTFIFCEKIFFMIKWT